MESLQNPFCDAARIHRYVAAPTKQVFSRYETRLKYIFHANILYTRSLTSTLSLSLVACAILYLEYKNKLYIYVF
jgi:hypothetical protein